MPQLFKIWSANREKKVIVIIPDVCETLYTDLILKGKETHLIFLQNKITLHSLQIKPMAHIVNNKFYLLYLKFHSFVIFLAYYLRIFLN